MKSIRFALASISVVCLACPGGCSSSSVEASSSDAAIDGTTSDGSGVDTAGPGGKCPATQPESKSSCASSGLTCEYGGTGSYLDCSVVATCQPGTGGTPAWFVQPPACAPKPSDNPPACPATFAPAATCPLDGGRCYYAEGSCSCTPCQGADGGFSNEWRCSPYIADPPGCPSPRPALGSACTESGKTCDYTGACCGGSTGRGPRLDCRDGYWQPGPGIGCDCALLKCGGA